VLDSTVNERMAVSGLFEAHLTVGNIDRAIAFYRDVVGLQLGLHDPELGAAFFWIGAPGRSMLGLWGAGSAPMAVSLHLAFAASLDDVLDAPDRLRGLGVTPLSFQTEETSEPSVIGWMPAAAVYFRDPDGHLLELLAMLDAAPDPGRRIFTWSEWSAKAGR
jgi:lactoylglutathione lyase